MDIEKTWIWFHQHAELSFKEFATTGEIKRLVRHIDGVELLELGCPTGALARLTGDLPGPVIMLRADIDALPIHEETTLAYPSLDKETMHACGHDFHIVNLLRTIEILAGRKKNVHGTVLFLFQPAEESGGGAKKLVEDGLLDRYKVSRVFGLHVQPKLKAGTIVVRDGAISAAVDRFAITIHGVGCHGAHPEEGLNPLPAACRLALGLESIVSHDLKPTDKAVVSVTHITGGTSWNVIPSDALLEGTNRTFSPQVRSVIKRCFEEKCRLLEAEGYHVDLHLKWGTPATRNDPRLVDVIRHEARAEGLPLLELDGGEMSGEDFAYYQESVPGAFYHVGVGGAYPLHSPRFELDLSVLEQSAQFMAKVAEAASLAS